MKSKRIVSIVVFGLIVVITPVIFALKSQVNAPLKRTINELNTDNKVSFNQTDWNAFESIEQKITVLKNTSVNFPLRNLNQKIARISIGTNTGYFTDALEFFADVDRFYFETLEEAIQKFPAKINQYDVIITAFHEHAEAPFNKIRLKDFLVELPSNKQLIGVIFGNPMEIVNEPSFEKMNTIIVGYENTLYAQDRIAQLIFGAIPASGKLPFSINDKYPKNAGILIESSGRLKFSQPEEFGISSSKFNRIDSIVTASIAKGAFPGCQIVVAYKGKIIYRKAFGRPTYESEKVVENSDVYDIASVSKIAGSTVGIMKLESEGKFSLKIGRAHV